MSSYGKALSSAASTLQGRRPAPAIIGMVEIAGRLDAREIFVSGWSRGDPGQGAPVFVFTDDRRIEGRFWAARFDRPDVGAGAGFSGVVELPGDIQVQDLRGLWFADHGRLGLYESLRIIDAAQSVALLQTALRSKAAADIPAPIRQVAARFTGTDTLSGTELPIRMGIDDCAMLGKHGLLVSGWLYDPERLVRHVRLGGASSEGRILSDGWTRQPRADVTASMRADPRFSGYAAPHGCHGFTALVDWTTGDADLHVSLDIEGVVPLHYPLAARHGRPLSLIKRFLGSISPDEPSALDIVDRRIVPILASLAEEKPRLLRVRGADSPESAPLSIVIGCSGDCEDVPALFAILATDPVARATPIVVAADAVELDAQGGDIERAAAFYGLHVRLGFGDGVDDAFDALTIGVEATQSMLACLTTMNVSPRTPNWLTLMTEALRQATDPSIVLPYVSDSGEAQKPSAAPEQSAYHDLSALLDCSLLRRSTFLAIGGFSHAFLTPSAKARDFIERLETSGVSVVPAASVAMTTIRPLPGPTTALADRADRLAARLRRPAPMLRIAG